MQLLKVIAHRPTATNHLPWSWLGFEFLGIDVLASIGF